MQGTAIDNIVAPAATISDPSDTSNFTPNSALIGNFQSDAMTQRSDRAHVSANESSVAGATLVAHAEDALEGGSNAPLSFCEQQTVNGTVEAAVASATPLASNAVLSEMAGGVSAYPSSSHFNNLNLDAIQCITDPNAYHFILDKSLEIVEVKELNHYEKVSIENANGVVMHILRGQSDRDPIKCVAISFKLDCWDVQSAAQTLNAKLNDWIQLVNTMNRRTAARDVSYDPRSAKKSVVNTASERVDGAEMDTMPKQRPTLFNLLEALANNNLTNAQQRNCIRGIVTDFLNNEVPHCKVYAYIGAVVGHEVLHTVIKNLENNPKLSPVPDATGLARIETAFGLSRSTANGNASATSKSTSTVTAPSVMQQQPPPISTVAASSLNSVNRVEVVNAIRMKIAGKGQQPPQGGKEVFDRVRWLPVRRPLSVGPLYGHSIICLGNKAYLFGGSNERSEGVSFRSSHVFNLIDFSSRSYSFMGEFPPKRDGHSANLVTLPSGPAIVVFGGFSNDAFLNDLYILEMDAKRWTRKSIVGPQPTPRDQHGAVVYPARSDIGSTKRRQHSALLFIFGGRTSEKNHIVCLNDLWAFHFSTSSWTQVQLATSAIPPPRFGINLVWSDDSTICLFGGETGGLNNVVLSRERKLLDDMWFFQVNSFDSADTGDSILSGEWTRETYNNSISPRSHYASIFITQRYQEPRGGEPKTIERLMIVTSGITVMEDDTSAKNKIVETDQLCVYFFSQKKWYFLKARYPNDYSGPPYGSRQRHVACFFEARNLVFQETRPSVPCLFVHGGFRRNHVLSDGWVLSLTGEDPFRGSSLPYATTAPSAISRYPNMALAGRMPPMAKSSPLWFQRDSHTPGLLWSFCSIQRWAFGAIAHLVDNSVHHSVASKNISIKWEKTAERDWVLSIQDDGQGLDFTVMHKILRLYGTYDPGDRSRKNYEYGCGFKAAFGRLSSSCVVMSRTNGTIGIGMLSQELMGHCDAKELAVPLCVWRLPHKELINKDPNNHIDHRHHQRLIMTYTPFGTPTLLAQQINMLGTNPGTRIVFWDIRDDLDHLVWNKKEQSIYLNSARDADTEMKAQYRRYKKRMNCIASCGLELEPFKMASAGNSAPSDAESVNPLAQKNSRLLEKGEKASSYGVHEKPFESMGTLNASHCNLTDAVTGSSKAAGSAHSTFVDAAPPKDVECTLADPTRPAKVEVEWMEVTMGPEMLDLPDAEDDEATNAVTSDGVIGNPSSVVECTTSVGGESGSLPPQLEAPHNSAAVADPKIGSSGSSSVSHASGRISAQGWVRSNKEANATFGDSDEESTEEEEEIPEVGMLPSTFPLWAVAKYAPDYCLATYLYWLYLHYPAYISIQNNKLIPKCFVKKSKVSRNPTADTRDDLPAEEASQAEKVAESGASKSLETEASIEWNNMTVGTTANQAATVNGDKPEVNKRRVNALNEDCENAASGEDADDELLNKYSLYSYLKQRLYCMAELEYLFSPEDTVAGCYGLVGFLNNPNDVSEEPRVCEAGICLYFRGRLICRLEGHFPENPTSIERAKSPTPESLFEGGVTCRFPLTAVLNVPNWMIPSMSKQEFLHENNWIFVKFKAKVMKLLGSYLKVCRSPLLLQQWLHNRKVKQQRFDDMQRYYKRKRKLMSRDSENEEEAVRRHRRSPTPPMTHVTPGKPIWSGERSSRGHEETQKELTKGEPMNTAGIYKSEMDASGNTLPTLETIDRNMSGGEDVAEEGVDGSSINGIEDPRCEDTLLQDEEEVGAAGPAFASDIDIEMSGNDQEGH